jgi:ABC-2 type transport system permease protein
LDKGLEQMKTQQNYFRETAHIIWTITAKDILDGFSNKTILTTIIMVFLLLGVQKVSPSIFHGDRPPILAVYDAGNSNLMPKLRDNPSLSFHESTSQEDMERTLGYENLVVLGLSLPADFDHILQSGSKIELTGRVDHWVSETEMAEIQTYFEGQLNSLTGKQVTINVQGDTVFTQPDGGIAFQVPLGMTILLIFFGLLIPPNIMLEEKQTKTIDALLVSPASSGQLIVAKALAGLFFCLIGALVAFAFYGVYIVHWGMAILTVVSGGFFAVSLGLLLGSKLEVRQQLSLWSFILLQPLLLPVILVTMQHLLPQGVITVLQWVPTVALAKMFRASLLPVIQFSQYLPELGLILGSTTLILAVLARVVRWSDR